MVPCMMSVLMSAAEPEASGRESEAESTAVFPRQPSTGRLCTVALIPAPCRDVVPDANASMRCSAQGKPTGEQSREHCAVPQAAEHGAPLVQHGPDQEQQVSAAVPLGGLAAGAVLCQQDVPAHPLPGAAV